MHSYKLPVEFDTQTCENDTFSCKTHTPACRFLNICLLRHAQFFRTHAPTRLSVILTRTSVILTRTSVVSTRMSVILTRTSVLSTRLRVIFTRMSVISTRSRVIFTLVRVIFKVVLLRVEHLYYNININMMAHNCGCLKKTMDFEHACV
jgi:hypothetical protein